MTLPRQACDDFEYTHHKFLLKDQTFNQQYSHLYNARMEFCYERCRKSSESRWPGVPMSRVVNLKQDTPTVIVGALYKNMKHKPDFLEQYIIEMGESERMSLEDSKAEFRADESDTLSLEDQSGRIDLSGIKQLHEMCTGLVVCVKGQVSGKVFTVDDWCFPPLHPQPDRTIPVNAEKPPCYIAFVSGLGFGANTPQHELQLDAVSSFLRGNLGCERIVRCISKLIVTGGLVAPTEDTVVAKKIKLEMSDHQIFNEAPLAVSMNLADLWISQVADAMPVDVMPTGSDPTNAFIPYQPIHPCLLSKSFDAVNTSLVPSPFTFVYKGVNVFGTSGENLTELRTYTLGTPNVKLLETLVKSGLMAPTAPDTLQCYPFKKVDPMQYDTAPHLVFAGNSSDFSTDLVELEKGGKTRVVSVPRFVENPGVTLVDFNSENLDTLFIPIDIAHEK
eukprot:TRINITY_DN34733_c0_g1_i1.p1 TRINITY_DN34733_c0_g1~~TRINITY_DN34733_c0_g1_i1.p1  ORF type:complete len:465 (+),score=55.33 TRINITY_DN34733_c0_g1_i1:56-1396(+)